MTLDDLERQGWTHFEIIRAFIDVLCEAQAEPVSSRVPARNFRGGLHYERRRAQ